MTSTKGHKGARVGDMGPGFITQRLGDIWRIRSSWQQITKDSIAVDTVLDIRGEKTTPWFYSMSVYRNDDSLQNLPTWLMENTPEETSAQGFSRQELQRDIPWQEYVERYSHKSFTKLFDRIIAVLEKGVAAGER